MKFQITGKGWALSGGTWIVPSGTIINSASDDVWSVRARGQTIPINAVPLDAQAWEAQLAAYGADHRHLLGGGWQ
jgi:hypothetical protein